MRRIAALVWIVALVILGLGAVIADASQRGTAGVSRGTAQVAGKKPGIGTPPNGGGVPVQLPAWVPVDLQVGQWYRIPNTNLATFPAAVNTDAQAQGWQGSVAGTNSCALKAYSGFGTDPSGKKIFVFGGGHSASWRNDILQIDLSQDAPTWSTRQAATSWDVINADFRDPAVAGPWLYAPSGTGLGTRRKNQGVAGLLPVFRSDGSVAQYKDKYPDDAPTSGHQGLRNRYNADKDAFYTLAMGVQTPGAGWQLINPPPGANEKNFSVAKHANGQWTYPNESGTRVVVQYFDVVSWYGNVGYVWKSADYGELYKYDTDAETWTDLGVSARLTNYGGTEAALAYDHTRNRLLAFKNGAANAWIVDLSTNPPTKTQITISGKFDTGSANLLYDERGDRFVFVQGQTANGSVKVYTIDAALTNPAFVEMTTSVYGSYPPATQGGRDNWSTVLIPEYGLLIWQANEPTSPVSNDCHLYALKLHEPQTGGSVAAQWDELVNTLDASGKLIAAEGFDSTPIRGAAKRVNSPCDAGLSTLWNQQFGQGNKIGCFSTQNEFNGGRGPQTGEIYRYIEQGPIVTGTSTLLPFTLPLSEPTTAPTLNQSPLSDGQRWPYSPMPDTKQYVAGDGAFRWTWSEFYAHDASYLGGEQGYSDHYARAYGGKYSIAFCNDWDPDCPNIWSPKPGKTRDLWIRLSYYNGENLNHLANPVPDWIQNWCTANPSQCPAPLQPGQPGPVISTIDGNSYPNLYTRGQQMKGMRWFGYAGKGCRHQLNGSNLNRNAYSAPGSGNNYSCNGGFPVAPNDGFQTNAFHPGMYMDAGTWGAQYWLWSSSQQQSGDPQPDKTEFFPPYGEQYNGLDYHPSTPRLIADGVLSNGTWTWTLREKWPWWTDYKVGDAWIFRPTSCTGISCNTTQWEHYGDRANLDTVTAINNANPNAPVVTTTAIGRSGQSGTAVAEVKPYCSPANPKTMEGPFFPFRAPGCRVWSGRTWYTVLLNLRYRDDTTQEPAGPCAAAANYGATGANACTTTRKGEATSNVAVEAPAWLDVWLKKEGEQPIKIASRPFGRRDWYPYHGYLGPASRFTDNNDLVGEDVISPGIGAFWLDNAFYYAWPSRFWNGAQKQGYSRPNDGVFMTVDNLLIAKNMGANWGDTAEAWKGAP